MLDRCSYTLIIIGLVFSIITSVVNTLNLDKVTRGIKGNEYHIILKPDPSLYFNGANEFKKDLENNKSFLESGPEYEHSYLHPRLIGLYFLLVNQEIKLPNSDEYQFLLKNFKFGIPIFQSFLYYFILFFFYKRLNNVFDKKISLAIIFFLSLDPTITQYHASYWTESIYFSILLIILFLLIGLSNLNNSKEIFISSFLIGFFVGISFLQRNVSLYLIVPILFWFFLFFKKKPLPMVAISLLGFLIVVAFLGYSNFKRSNIFYIIPWDQKNAPYTYLAHQLNNETVLSKEEKKEIWLNKNEIDAKDDKNKILIAKYQNDYFIESLKKNPFKFIKIALWKSSHALILDPKNISNEYQIDKNKPKYWEDFNYQLKYRIIYSFVVYAICAFGFFTMFNDNLYKRYLSILIIFISIFYIAFLGWVGTSRYLVPILIFFSIFFGVGLIKLLKLSKLIK